ncbi:hypothetical protein KIPB_010262, partial [Kipferlia bialata]|eukprot:g10262.t1
MASVEDEDDSESFDDPSAGVLTPEIFAASSDVLVEGGFAAEHLIQECPDYYMDSKYQGQRQYRRSRAANLTGVGLWDVANILSKTPRLEFLFLGHNQLMSMMGVSLPQTLFKLDLSHNHISSLPSSLHLGKLKALRILLLHHNKFETLTSVSAVSDLPSLNMLTLYDTPVSSLPQYRHFLVNTCPELRVLDGYFISDQEWMEDSHFGGKFAAFSDEMAFGSHPYGHPDIEGEAGTEGEPASARGERVTARRRDTTTSILRSLDPYEVDEYGEVFDLYCCRRFNLRVLLSELEELQHKIKHLSPAVIIQRHVRGWLCRCRLKRHRDTISGAITVVQAHTRRYLTQRWYRREIQTYRAERDRAARVIQRIWKQSYDKRVLLRRQDYSAEQIWAVGVIKKYWLRVAKRKLRRFTTYVQSQEQTGQGFLAVPVGRDLDTIRQMLVVLIHEMRHNERLQAEYGAVQDEVAITSEPTLLQVVYDTHHVSQTLLKTRRRSRYPTRVDPVRALLACPASEQNIVIRTRHGLRHQKVLMKAMRPLQVGLSVSQKLLSVGLHRSLLAERLQNP